MSELPHSSETERNMKISLPQLTTEERDNLGMDTTNEIGDTIDWKASGPDGLPVELYTFFRNIFAPLLNNMFKHSQ